MCTISGRAVSSANCSAVSSGHVHTVPPREQPNVVSLSHHDALRESVDPGKGHMEVREDAHRAALDDVFAEAGEIARPRAAGVDAGRNRAAAREVFGVNAERRASPINVRVKIDEARGDNEARYV